MQAGRQVTSQAHLPPMGRKQFSSGRHSPSPRGRKQLSSISGRSVSQAGSFPSQCLPSPHGRKQFSSIPSPQAGAHLPSREGSNSSITQAVPLFSGDSTSSQAGSEATTYTPAGENPTQAGNNLPSSQASSQVIRSRGIHPGKGPSRLPRGTALPPRQTALVPRKAIPLLIHKIGFPKGLSQKTQAQSESLTYPANFWHQH